MIENLDPEKPNGEAKNLHDIEVMANEPTVVNLVNLIISTALRERASDIHLVPFENSIQLRYRVDGLLQENPPPPKHLHAALVSRIKIMADMNIAERFMPQDGHIQINNRGARVDIRVGTMPTIYGESLVMRLLEKNSKVSTAEELGLDPERAKMLSSLVEKPHGLFLTTGPTGSGKTTTLYSILQSIYTPELKILTIEDPVEYELHGVAQIPGRGPAETSLLPRDCAPSCGRTRMWSWSVKSAILKRRKSPSAPPLRAIKFSARSTPMMPPAQ